MNHREGKCLEHKASKDMYYYASNAAKLTNMLPNLFVVNSATFYVNAAECKHLHGVCITGDDFFETLNLPRSPSMRIRRKINYFRL